MPKLMNPNYQQPDIPIDAAQQAISDWFVANPGTESVTFDQLRNHFKSNGFPNADQWTDGEIDQRLRAWGFEVVV